MSEQPATNAQITYMRRLIAERVYKNPDAQSSITRHDVRSLTGIDKKLEDFSKVEASNAIGDLKVSAGLAARDFHINTTRNMLKSSLAPRPRSRRA